MLPISRRKIKKLLRESSSDGSLSLSLNKTKETISELSIEKIRKNLGKNCKPEDQSAKNLTALFKVYQMESNKYLDSQGCFNRPINEYFSLFNHLYNQFKQDPQFINQNWHHMLSLHFNNKFDNYASHLVHIIFTTLQSGVLEPTPSLFLINYLIIQPFWADFAALSIDKSNTTMQYLKGIVKIFTKIVKNNAQKLFSNIYLQMVENICAELYPFLLILFQTIKKKSNYFYSFIVLTEIIDKLMKKNMLRSLNVNTLNQLELNLNKKQKVIFDEIFMKQADPIFDKHLVLRSTLLRPYREEIFNIFLAFDYRNSINFNQLLYTFDNLYEICKKIEQEYPKANEKLLEFKVLVKTMSELFEYFCCKLSNLNTECLILLDNSIDSIEYMTKFLSNKKKQELLNAYIKVNEYFDKEPSVEVMEQFDASLNLSKKKKSETKVIKQAHIDFSNSVMASLKLVKKISDLRARVIEMGKLFEMIRDTREYTLNMKAKLKISKSVLKLLNAATESPEVDSDLKQRIDDCLINFLEIPSATQKNILAKLRQKYEHFILTHGFQGKGEIFKLITRNLENIFMNDEDTREILATLPEEFIPLKLQQEISNKSSEKAPAKSSHPPTTLSHQEAPMKEEEPPALSQEFTKLKNQLEETFKNLTEGVKVLPFEEMKNKLFEFQSFLEESEDVTQAVTHLSNSEIDLFIDLVNNVLKNLAANWLVYLPDSAEAVQELKTLLKSYRKFLRDISIFTRSGYHLYIEESNLLLAHSFVPIKYDEKSEVIEYESNQVTHPTTKETIPDAVYFFRLSEIPLKSEVRETFVNDFGSLLASQKSRIPILTKLKEQARNNETFKVYGLKQELVKGTILKNLIASYENKTGTTTFVFIPMSFNTITL